MRRGQASWCCCCCCNLIGRLQSTLHSIEEAGTDSRTDRQTDRHTHTHTYRVTDADPYTQTHRHACRYTDTQTLIIQIHLFRWSGTTTQTPIHRHRYKQWHTHKDRHKLRQAETDIHRQILTNRYAQRDRHKQICTDIERDTRFSVTLKWSLLLPWQMSKCPNISPIATSYTSKILGKDVLSLDSKINNDHRQTQTEKER